MGMKLAKYISVALAFTIFLSGCSNEESEPTENNDNELDTVQENMEENQENEIDSNDENENIDENQGNEANEVNEANENNELNQDENNENEESEDVAIQEQDPIYELHNNIAIRPIDDANEEIVLLTIDDAPDKHGPEMAQVLKDLDAKAIFFVNGHFIQTDEGREQLKEIYELGFEIGNHTMNHPNLSNISEDEQYEEIVYLNDLIEEITGERPRFFRAPFGVNTDYSKQLMEEEGMQWMNWTYGYDWEADYMEKNALEEIMVETNLLGNGANLLMHDREFTKDALPGIVEGLREKGYEIVDTRLIK
jgi:peptidoglycan/xylan/chitin deacetylase (PgdA/CDA1 family)